MSAAAYRDLFVTASDGLRLYARDYGRRHGTDLPVVCLPGLARHSGDFHGLATRLADDPHRPRRVLAVDYRGRGRSEYDRDWRRYDLKVELNDLLQMLTAAEIEEAVFVGTSRGGLLTMALSAARPALLQAAVLNDVGPALEGRGLVRIRSYVGRLPLPRSFEEGAEILRRQNDAQFPAYGPEDWLAMAQGTWHETQGGLALSYDPALAKVLENIDIETPIPPLWFLFEGLTRVPTLALRGANSDLLSSETLSMMATRHPGLTAITIPDQGHAPALRGSTADHVIDFINRLPRSV